ncbi:hypothetical protein BGX23_004879 [Mortierella sp. AD031]|nr:hypothetical protein BGX23_004879 [Mortierella sp. AD031]
MSATQRFFSIVDFVHILAPLLQIKDISRITQTNHQMRAMWLSSLYRNLNMTYYSWAKRLLRSADAKLTLGRHVRHVRVLKLGLAEMVYIYNSLLALIDITLTANTEPIVRPGWLPLPDRQNYHVVPLPPMTELRQLEMYLDRSKDNSMCPYLMASVNNPRANLAQVCWITLQSPNLVDLTLKSLVIKGERGLRLFTTVLTRLPRLQSLKLSVVTKSSNWLTCGWAIFFSCSATTQKLQIEMQNAAFDRHLAFAESFVDINIMDHVQGYNDHAGVVGGDREVKAPIFRTMRLFSLTDLALWEMDGGATAKDIVSVFVHCPNIERLTLPNMRGEYDAVLVAQIIGDLCPNLRQMNCRGWKSNRSNMQLPFEIMSAIPEQGLQEICSYSCYSKLDDTAIRKSFMRHSAMLQKIVFEACRAIDSRSLGVLLVECPSLEVLQVTWAEGQRGPTLQLDDATAKPWASRKFTRLSLTIGILALPLINLNLNQMPYYLRPGPVVLTGDESAQFAVLEILYRQIGSLTELEYLDLRVDMVDGFGDSFDDTPYENHCFPGLLSLGNKRTGRKGYLDLLGGLTKLKELRGSVYVRADETEKTVGLREVVWFDDHFPNLQLAEFFSDNESVSDPFKWLQDQRGKDSQLELSVRR